MPARPLLAVPNIFATEGTGSINNIPLLDQDFSTLVNQGNDSAIGYNNFAVDTGSVNAYVLTLASPPSAYITGMMVTMQPLNTNTGPSTINVNAVGSVSILLANGGPLVGGELVAGSATPMVFNGTSFALIDANVVSMNFGATSVNQTVICQGASSVSISLSTATSGLNLTLSRIGVAVPVCLSITNTSGIGVAFGVQATNAFNTSITCLAKASNGTLYTLNTTGVTLGVGVTIFIGSTFPNAVVFNAL